MDRKAGLFRRSAWRAAEPKRPLGVGYLSDSGNSFRARASTIMSRELLVTAIGAACLAFVVAAWGQSHRIENEAVPGHRTTEAQAPEAASNVVAQADRAVNEGAKANDQTPRSR